MSKGYFKRGDRYVVRPYIGGRHQYVATVASEEEAKALVEDYTKRGSAGLETVGDFATRWVDDYPRPKESTNYGNAQRARQIAQDRRPIRVDGRLVIVPGLRLRDVTRSIARAYVRDNRSLLPILRAMFSDAVDDGLIGENPFARLGLEQSKGRKNVVPLTEDELEALADAARETWGTSSLAGESDYGIEFAGMILFAAYTGLRESELFGLERADVDTKGSRIHVRRRVYRNTTDTPKNGLIRTVALPPPAAEVYRSHSITGERIFLTKQRKPFANASSLYYYWSKTVLLFESRLDPARRRQFAEHRPKRKGVTERRMEFHELKHFCGHHLYVTLGLDAEIVATQLGHTDHGDLVRSTYGHRDTERDLDAIHAAFGQNVRELRAVDDEEATG